ncbi:hypothetical protein BLNAU_16324 [Blattamonas nauphoetae]|uniref:Uncharacterized protein n=1 Tax=Blattamonas nauphoetae TaxID=2049346 RepID=A0ABQ9XEF4_9EUKA|nr:hypothetical protein BLNAU_16324 [Blattamonas nauphoetae]
MKIWSYHVVDAEWQTSIIACVDYTNVQFENCIIADFASQATIELPKRVLLNCVWDGQVASVRVANTKCKFTNTTFDGICLGGLSLRNTLPWDEPVNDDPPVLLELDTFLFRGNRWPQPTTDGIRAYVPNRNLFVLSQTDDAQVIIHKGHADFDGGEELSGPLEIYGRGVDFVTDVGEPGVYRELKPIRTAPSFDAMTFSVKRGSSRDNTIVTLTVTGSNLFRCGSNLIAISPYFKDTIPLNPSWRTMPIVEEHGMEKIVAEVKSSDLWPAGQWLLRTTIAAVNYVHYDIQDWSYPGISPNSALCSLDCSPFLNWNEEKLETEDEKAVVYWSLVATVKLHPVLDNSLEEKAVKFLRHVSPASPTSANAFLNKFASNSDESSTIFVQSIVLLLSSYSQVIATTAMQILHGLYYTCSTEVYFALFRGDLIPQLIAFLHPLSLSLSDCEHIHYYILSNIERALRFTPPNGLARLGNENGNEQQTVHETILKRVVAPSEKIIQEPAKTRTEQQPSLSTLNHLLPILLVSTDFNTTLSLCCVLI